MGDKETFQARVNELLINPDAIEKIELFDSKGNIFHSIPNEDGKRNSLQIYSAITTNRGWIGSDEAKQGLQIFGQELREETKANPGKHRNIEILEEISEKGTKVRSNIHRKPEAKPLPISENQLKSLLQSYTSPFIVYLENEIIDSARRLNNAFSWVPGGFKNYFAVKACPNDKIIKLLQAEGLGADCSSAPELTLSSNLGISGEEIMFTANDVPAEEFALAKKLGAIINFDDLTHIPYFIKNVGALPETACCRFNPGSERVGNSIIGNPIEAKYGMIREQILEAFQLLRENGVKRFGIHTMIASNERNSEYFVETARMMFSLAALIKKQLGIEVEFINLGGGIGTPYRPEQKEVDLSYVSSEIKKEFDKRVSSGEIRKDIKLFMECGRCITGPHGFLVSKVRHMAKKYKDFVGLDACMANLMRPALYDAYHHLSILGKDSFPRTKFYDVTGSLCENNDKFAVDRALPEIKVGDVFIIHNAGAHGYAMGFNYNGKLKCAEILLNTKTGKHKIIRRAETEEDYFATLKV